MIARRGTIEVVGEFDTPDELADRLQRLAPDLVLITLRSDEGDDIGSELATLLPRARIVAFSSDARDAFLYRAPLQRTALLDISPQTLIDAITGI
jgi:DNA-binding NarL/FixJ family response regulator